MSNTCGSCMAFNWDKSTDGFLGSTKFYCNRFGCYRYADQSACDAFVADNSCFLTSACVAYKGLKDNCVELNTLRYFRDTYMKSLDDGADLIKQYYDIAPTIVESINSSKNKDEYYSYIFEQIKICIDLINKKEYSKTLEIYKRMTLTLKKELIK